MAKVARNDSNLTVSLSDPLREELEILAALEGQPLSSYMRHALQEYAEQQRAHLKSVPIVDAIFLDLGDLLQPGDSPLGGCSREEFACALARPKAAAQGKE